MVGSKSGVSPSSLPLPPPGKSPGISHCSKPLSVVQHDNPTIAVVSGSAAITSNAILFLRCLITVIPFFITIYIIV